MAKKNTEEFNDPLEDIDPIMREAFIEEDIEENNVQDEDDFINTFEETDVVNDIINEVVNEEKEDVVETISEKIEDAATITEVPSFDVEPNLETLDIDALEDEDIETIIDEEVDTMVPDFADESVEKKPNTIDNNTSNIANIDFPNLSEESKSSSTLSPNLFQNIPIEVSVELGRSNLSLKEIYELSEGSIIELQRLTGETLDLVVNDQVIAQGEVVTIDNKYGLRIKEISDQKPNL